MPALLRTLALPGAPTPPRAPAPARAPIPPRAPAPARAPAPPRAPTPARALAPPRAPASHGRPRLRRTRKPRKLAMKLFITLLILSSPCDTIGGGARFFRCRRTWRVLANMLGTCLAND
ncbi:MAG: hypothetical protein DCC49_03380 [Acidobacteria bacterium]|nr:MAG: hypothetical protein DCC49_03380 [Acidobacteriota bacterium]